MAFSWTVEPIIPRPLKALGWRVAGRGEMELSPYTCALFSHASRWSDPITLRMKGWGWLALLLGVLLGTAWARRSQDLHCGGKGTKTRRSGRKPTLGRYPDKDG